MITIKGIKLSDISVSEDSEGKEKITAHYQLLTSEGRSLGAKESLTSVSEYGGTVFMPSPQTIKALRDASMLYRKDVEMSMGLETT